MAITLTTTSACPGHDGGRGQSDGAGRPAAASRECGREPHVGYPERLRQERGVDAPTGVESESVDVVTAQTGILQSRQNGVAGQFEHGLRR